MVFASACGSALAVQPRNIAILVRSIHMADAVLLLDYKATMSIGGVTFAPRIRHSRSN
jgi:hypothetical protein